MNHRETVTQSDRRFKDRIQYMKRAHPDIPFVIGEAAASLGNNSGIPDYDLAASLGTALWTIDWILYTMTLVCSPSPLLKYSDDAGCETGQHAAGNPLCLFAMAAD